MRDSDYNLDCSSKIHHFFLICKAIQYPSLKFQKGKATIIIKIRWSTDVDSSVMKIHYSDNRKLSIQKISLKSVDNRFFANSRTSGKSIISRIQITLRSSSLSRSSASHVDITGMSIKVWERAVARVLCFDDYRQLAPVELQLETARQTVT